MYRQAPVVFFTNVCNGTEQHFNVHKHLFLLPITFRGAEHLFDVYNVAMSHHSVVEAHQGVRGIEGGIEDREYGNKLAAGESFDTSFEIEVL